MHQQAMWCMCNLPTTVAVEVVRMISLTLELDMTFLNDRAAESKFTHSFIVSVNNNITFIRFGKKAG